MSGVGRWPGLSGVSGLVVGFVIATALLFLPQYITAQRSRGTVVGKAIPRECISVTSLTTGRVSAFAEAGWQRRDYLPGEVLLRFKPGVPAAQQERALQTLGSRPRPGDLEWTGDIALWRDPEEPDAERLAARLSLQPEIEFAQANYVRQLPGRASSAGAPIRVGRGEPGPDAPDDPDYRSLQWNLAMLDMPGAAGARAAGASPVIVAVIDTGLTMSSSTLSARLWTGQQFDTVGLRFETSPDLSVSRIVSPGDYVFDLGGTSLLDFTGHGTHVALTIAADTGNQVGLAGMAPNVRIMPVKVCAGYWELMLGRAASGITGFLPGESGGCTDGAIAQGIRYAVDNGARVLNLGLTGGAPSPIIFDALGYAASRGAFVAVAAGNGYESGNPVEYPAGYAARLDGVMAVGSVGKSRSRAYYSSTGAHVEIAAPGGSTRDAGGLDQGLVWQITLAPGDADPSRHTVPRFDRYAGVGYTGTSMATSHVAALAALLMSQGMTDPAAVERLIKSSALDLGASGRDDEFGYGLIQPRAALASGTGR